jgi:hypothetical protein
MRRFICGWKKLGYEERFKSKIVNYADDLVICCRGGNADQALSAMRYLMALLKLTVNEDKTRVCRVPQESFDFLGYTIGRQYSFRWQKFYIGLKPSKKSISRMMESIGALTGLNRQWMDAEAVIAQINRKLRGWTNYFQLGAVSQVYGCLEMHTLNRLRRWACRKHKIGSKGTKRFPFESFFKMGLIRLTKIPQTLSKAKA